MVRFEKNLKYFFENKKTNQKVILFKVLLARVKQRGGIDANGLFTRRVGYLMLSIILRDGLSSFATVFAIEINARIVRR